MTTVRWSRTPPSSVGWVSQVKAPWGLLHSPPPPSLYHEQRDDTMPSKLSAGVPWSADIVLNDTRVSDAGIYRCMVNNPPETPDPGIGELELSVVGTWAPSGQADVSATFHPHEKANNEILFAFSRPAPPSLPVCQWDGDVNVGGSVTLSCSVAEGTPTPEIRWTKMNPEEVELPINMDGQCQCHV